MILLYIIFIFNKIVIYFFKLILFKFSVQRIYIYILWKNYCTISNLYPH